MKVYNQTKNEILTDYDLEKGYLKEDILETIIPAVDGVEEQGHYETVKEYENGGKDVAWSVDVAGVKAQEERTETENILVYVPYTEEELKEQELKTKKENIEKQINELKKQLSALDYKTIKYVEGQISEEEFEELKIFKKSLRNQINELQEK